MIGLPPSLGAFHVTVALPSPAVADTPVGVPGAVGGAAGPPPWNTTVPISHTVLAPAPAVALGVAPDDASTWSSVSRSMFDALETLLRWV